MSEFWEFSLRPEIYVPLIWSVIVSFLMLLLKSFFPFLKSKLLHFLKGVARKKQLEYLIRLRKDRHSIASVNYQISRNNTYFLLFIGTICFAFMMMFLSPAYRELFERNIFSNTASICYVGLLDVF